MANPTQIFDEDGQYSLKVNPDGSINVTANIEITESDIQIGAVEIKDATTQERATVSTAYGLKVDVSRIQGGTVTVQDGGGSITVDGTVSIGNSVTIAEPVTVDGTVTIQDGGGSITVDGSVSLSSPVAISGVVPISDNGGSLTVDGTVNIGNSVEISGPVSISGSVPVTDGGGSLTVDGAVSVSNTVTVQDGGGSLTVDGTVTVQDGGGSISVDDGGGTLTVDGTVNVGNTVVVSDGNGSLTVDGTVNVGNTVTVADGGGSLTVDGSVSVLGTVPVSDAGGSLTVDGSVSIVGTPTRTASFTLQNAASAIGNGTQADVTGYATGVFSILITGTATITVERSQDGTNWYGLETFYSATSGYPTNIALSSKLMTADLSGCVYIRARVSAYTSGTVSVSLQATLSEGGTTGGAVFQPTADAQTGAVPAQAVTSFGMGYNGSTWDRLRVDANKSLKSTLIGATGNQISVNADGSINVNTNADIQIGAVELKDATTDTRATIDTTYGLKVDVSRVSGSVNVADGGGSITVDDGGSSLTVDGTVSVSGSVAVTDNGSSLTVDDGGSSLTVDGTINVGNTVTVSDGSGSLTVDTTQLPATLTASGNLKVALLEGGLSGSVQITDGTDTLAVNANGSINVADGGGSLTVDGSVSVTNFPTSYPVTDGGGSITVDGTVNVGNAVSISGAVPVTDNGGSLTVDGTVTIQDGGNSITVDSGQLPAALTAGGYLKVSVQENTTNQTVTIQDGGNVISVDDAGGSLTVDSPQLPSALTGSGNLKVSIAESTTGISVTDGGGSLTVDGSVSVSGTVTATSAAAQMQTFTLQSSAGAVGNGTAADITGFDVFVIQTTITGTATITFEQSTDNSSWHVAVGQLVTTAGALVSTATASNVYKFSVSGMKYFRARISSWTSGTVSATGYATTGEQVFIPITSQYGSSDTNTTGHYLQGVGAYNLLFDGTNWTRQRTVSQVGDGVTGTGSLSAGLIAFNGTTWDRVRTVNTGQLRTSLYGTTGNALAVNADGSLNVNTNADIQIGAVEIKDGTTDTRAVVDSTYGLKVDVSRVGGSVTIQDGGNSITVDGSVTVGDGGGSLTIDSTQLPASLTASGNFKVSLAEDSTVISVDDGGASLTVDSAQLPSTLTGSGNLKVSLSESAATVTVADGGGSITTDSAQLPAALTGSGNLKVALSESGATVSVADGGGSLTVDSTQLPTALTAGGNLKVAIQEGGLTGSVSNASDTVATSSTNLGTVAYNYGFNGTTWDRFRLDGSDNLKVSLSASTATVNVADGGGSLTVDGTVAISNASIAVTDNGGSLTVDSAQLPTSLTAGGNLKMSLSESSATVNVADGGGSLTVDGTVAISNASIPVTDNGGSLTVDSAQLPTALTAGGNLKVAIQEGGFSGSVSNASDSVATSSTNIGAVSYLYGFDGTTWDRLKVDTSGNLQVTAGPSVVSSDFTFQNAAGAVGNGSVATVTGYSVATLRVVITGTATVAFEASNDNTNFDPIAGLTPFVSAFSNTVTSSNTYQINVAGYRYLRARVSVWTSGTVTVIGTFGQGIPRAPHGLIVTSIADGLSGSNTAQLVQSAGAVYNGTTWDRVRSSSADALAATGVQAAGNMFYNGSTWDRGRTATADALAATGIQAKGTMLYNGTTWDRARTATADGLAVTGLQGSALMGYNGTTWDRIRVDASKNLNVNVAKATSGSATLFNAVTTTGTSTAVSVDGYASAFVSVETGPNFGTIFKLEGTVDGTKWWTLRGLDHESGAIDGQFQGDRSIQYNISGLLQVRGNITAIVGTTTVKLRYQTSEVSIGPREISVSNFPATPTEISIKGTTYYYLEPNADGSLAIGDGTDTLAINTDGSINITDNGGSITVDGTVAISNSSIAVTDNGGSLTVDSAQLPSALTSSGNFKTSIVEVQSSNLFTFQNAAGAIGDGSVADVSAYESAALLFATTGTATTVVEVSNNNSTWTSISGFSPNLSLDSYALSFTNGHFQFNVSGYKYLRARVSSWTSGTVTVTGYFSQGAVRSPHGKMTTAFGDGISNGTTAQAVSAYGAVFNGSGWDRVRTASGDGLAATGVMASGNMGFNGTTWDRLRTVSAGDGIGTGLLAQGGYVWDSVGLVWNRARSANGVADAATGTTFGASAQIGWNGASFDRVRVNNKHVFQEYLLLTNGQHLDIWTPATGKKFRLMSVLIGSRTAAELILRDATNSTTFSNIATFNIGGRDTKDFDFRNGYLSTTANNKLAVYNQTGSTVALWATFIGTEE